MTRPTYETQADIAAERAFADLLVRKWRAESAHKLPKAYAFDFALLRDGAVRAMVEVKFRSAEYPTLIMSLHKWQAGRWFLEQGLAAIFAIHWPSGFHYYAMTGAEDFPIRVGGRSDRNDWQDQEPVIHIPRDQFRKV